MQNIVHKIICFDCGFEFNLPTGINPDGKFINAFVCLKCGTIHSIPSIHENDDFKCSICNLPLERISFNKSEFHNNSESTEETIYYIKELSKHGAFEVTEPCICCPRCKSHNLIVFRNETW